MYIFDPDNPDSEEIKCKNGNKKIIEYHYSDGGSGLKLEATHMTTKIYNKKGKLISKTTEKNPNEIY